METWKSKYIKLNIKYQVTKNKYNSMVHCFNTLLAEGAVAMAEKDIEITELSKKNTDSRVALLMIREQVDSILGAIK